MSSTDNTMDYVTDSWPDAATVPAADEALPDVTAMCIVVAGDHARSVTGKLLAAGFTQIIKASHKTVLAEYAAAGAAHNTLHTDLLVICKDESDLIQKLQHSTTRLEIPVIALDSSHAETSGTNRQYDDNGYICALPASASDQQIISAVTLALKFKQMVDLGQRHRNDLGDEIAEKRVLQARLDYLVSHDDLTGLCNRKILERAIGKALVLHREHGIESALLYIDLDQFKIINDLEGHNNGDRLVIKIAHLLRQNTGEGHILARIGADDYAIMANNCNEVMAIQYAEKIRTELERFEFECQGSIYHLGACIGIAVTGASGVETPDDMLSHADHACLRAKRSPHHKIHVYRHHDNDLKSMKDAVGLIPRIRRALQDNNFFLVYQPLLDIDNNRIVRYEALIRMQEDDHVLTPNIFIPVAEKMGMINIIDRWVIGTAFKNWREHHRTENALSISINLSSHAFTDNTLIDIIKEHAAENSIIHDRFIFEITETAAIANYDKARALIYKLRDMGFHIALDDFGVGFSSFDHLKRLPVDILKIDGSFITNLKNDIIDQTLVRAISDIARKLGKITVAEYVEDQQTLDLLRSYHIDYAQGYLIGKPAPINFN
ncbi:MAG: GGDEF domain-containing protein [Gammaproteobacteria bacterium]|nr:GGDEF domain-containing protein [Gammaproteobacteria bacterium]